MRWIAVVAVVLVVPVAPVAGQGGTLLPLPGLNSAQGEHSPDITLDGRFIVFQSARPGGAGAEDIYLYDRQSASLVPLPGLNSRGPDFAPTVSADGRYIAFASVRSGALEADIYLYERTRGTLVPLPDLNTPREESFPIISGDGRFIAYRSGRIPSDIRLYDRVAGADDPLPGLNTRDHEDNPALSDDGRFIAFFREEASSRSLYLGDYLYDREARSVTRLPDNVRVMDIAPGGELLLFLWIRLPAVDIAMFDRSAGRVVELPGLNSSEIENAGKMTSDSRFIVFVSFRTGLMNPDIFLYQRRP